MRRLAFSISGLRDESLRLQHGRKALELAVHLPVSFYATVNGADAVAVWPLNVHVTKCVPVPFFVDELVP